MRTRTRTSKCQHLKGWKFKSNPDGSVTRVCRVRSCGMRITELAAGRGLNITPMKGNYTRKRKDDA